tara:strand:- start:23 stop:667 length:645 start_codon:yes stop_codon:yes gene_type:complete
MSKKFKVLGVEFDNIFECFITIVLVIAFYYGAWVVLVKIGSFVFSSNIQQKNNQNYDKSVETKPNPFKYKEDYEEKDLRQIHLNDKAKKEYEEAQCYSFFKKNSKDADIKFVGGTYYVLRKGQNIQLWADCYKLYNLKLGKSYYVGNGCSSYPDVWQFQIENNRGYNELFVYEISDGSSARVKKLNVSFDPRYFFIQRTFRDKKSYIKYCSSDN